MEEQLKHTDAVAEDLTTGDLSIAGHANLKRKRTLSMQLEPNSTKGSMEKKETYQEKMEAQLKEWTAKLEELKAKAQQASADVKIQYQEQIETLRTKFDATQAKLQELRTAGEGAWEDLKAGIENAWSELKNAWETAVSKFK